MEFTTTLKSNGVANYGANNTYQDQTKKVNTNIIDEKRGSMSELAYKIMLDRYSLKDTNRKTLDVGDIVIVIVNGDNNDIHQKREIAIITRFLDDDDVEVVLYPTNETIVINKQLVDKPLETTHTQLIHRIARGAATIESKENRRYWTNKFNQLLEDMRFVPGGRIMAALGTEQRLSYYNCFVLPMEGDSRGGIMETLGNMTEIMSRGGGVGINISKLRPRHAYVKGVNGRSSGAVSWGALFSFVTGLVEQSGSRRGALMLILNDWHPDIFDFINSKREAGHITNANISIGISDALMQAIKNDNDWQLRFPDTSYPNYDKLWDGDLEKWEALNLPVIQHKTVRARDLWNAIVESAWDSAEPGMWFRDRANKYWNGYYYSSLISTNPCGEQPLSAFSVCNLGAINLSKFWDEEKQEINYRQLIDTTNSAVRFLDNVIDITPYFFDENESVQKSERRIGLGIMGLAELLIKAGVRYGSEEGIKTTDTIFKIMRDAAYKASIQLAKEKGPFPQFDAEKYLAGDYAKTLPAYIREDILKYGIRNVTLLTVAPTGTSGTMAETSTGIEPFFSWVYYRQGRLGLHEEKVGIVQEWQNANSQQTLPNHFITAMELTPREHVNMMAAAQKYVDSSISKTCNVPNDWTVDQVAELYMYMYDTGCKGGTIYRDGSRDEQVLMLKEKQEEDNMATDNRISESEDKPIVTVEGSGYKVIDLKRQPVLQGVTIKGATPMGNAFITINEDPNGIPYEVFITIGKSGSDLQAQAESMGRSWSVAMQYVPLAQRKDLLQQIVNQNRNIGGARQNGFGPNRTASFPDAIAKIIQEQYLDKNHVVVSHTHDTNNDDESVFDYDPNFELPPFNFENDGITVSDIVSNSSNDKKSYMKYADTCPECHNNTLLRQEGCKKCGVCGYSEC